MEKAYQRIKFLFMIALLWAFMLPIASSFALSLISDEETEVFLAETVRPLFLAAGLSFDTRRIFIVNDKALNAFVSDGNNMFVTSGTIMNADSQNELMGVLAHETGHIEGGHILRHKIKTREVETISLASMLLGGAAGLAAGRADVSLAAILGAQGQAYASLLSYQVSEERSADEAAVKLLKQVNQSPRGLFNFMKKIQKQNTLQGIEESSYFRTHPVTSERLSFLEKATRDYKGNPAGREENDFLRVKAKLYANISEPKKTFIKYKENDTSIPARYARTIAHFKQLKMKEALADIQGLIEEEPNNPYFWELKGQMLLETSRIAPAVEAYRQALKLHPDSAIFKLNLAQALLENSPDEATQGQIVNLLNQVLIYNPNSYAWILLSRAYGLQKDAAGYNYAAAQASFLSGDLRLAKKQLQQALQSSPSQAIRLKADDLMQRISDEEKKSAQSR